jgi:hypothetical protein
MRSQPELSRVIVNIVAWLVGVLSLAVVAGLVLLLTLPGVAALTILAWFVCGGIIFLAAGWTVTVVFYLPVEIEFT